MGTRGGITEMPSLPMDLGLFGQESVLAIEKKS